MSFKLTHQSNLSVARVGKLTTAHGVIATPFFMPVATKAAIKGVTTQELKDLQAQILLSNTYHLYLRPGMKIMQQAQGLHNFMQWDKPILTDSGGFQVFSLDQNLERQGVKQDNQVGRKITSKGVEFKSHLDGSKHMFTPQKVIQIQHTIGSDIMMVLDECVANPATKKQAAAALSRTTAWARQSLQAKQDLEIDNQLIFAIVQGSTYKSLRQQAVQQLLQLEKEFPTEDRWDGFAVGGLAVGETNAQMYKVLNYTVPLIPQERPRYLMGVGYPENIVRAVRTGIDMFDCVIPTREARHGRIYRWSNKLIDKQGKFKHQKLWQYMATGKKFYQQININNAKYKSDFTPINQFSKLEPLRNYSLAYLHHLFKTGEPLSLRLSTLNNLEFYMQLMQHIRIGIQQDKF